MTHFAAFLCTFAAGFRTSFTMFHMAVFFTLSRTCITYICTNATYHFCKVAIPGHKFYSQMADISTILVELYTQHQHFNICFMKTRVDAFTALNGTIAAGSYTGLKFFGSHFIK
jgi:hypothetical protein